MVRALPVVGQSLLGACVLLFLGLLPMDAAAQSRAGLHATRPELEQMLAAHEGGTSVGGEHQVHSRVEAAAIRARLEQGDFQTGDQIVIMVEGHQDLSGTYTVEPDQTISLPLVGSIPLRGVLRSELQPYLTEHLGRFVREPRVRAESTIRVIVLGAVGRPGFYSVPSNALVTDVITQAGGTGGSSQLTRIRIERDGRQLIGGRELQNAIIEGRTIDQLSVRAGDQVIVPERGTGRLRTALTAVGTAASLTYLILRVSRLW